MDYYKIENLYQYIKRFCLYSATDFIGNIGARLSKRYDSKILSVNSQRIVEWQLTFIAKSLIFDSNDIKVSL